MPSSARPTPTLHSFPTRRSSDLSQPVQQPRRVFRQRERVALRFARPIDDVFKFNQILFHGSQRIAGSEAIIDDAPRRLRRSDTNRRSEEHTSELQSPYDLVCRLLHAPPPLSTLSLHDALPISPSQFSNPGVSSGSASASHFASPARSTMCSSSTRFFSTAANASPALRR